ncbi:uncharacterized protein PG986_003974 [Apiospora aurea]|uniref:Uncharacterized protein n=1 Tax=Apiospora aurea TaxID=335848 RepID=A0ABR1QL88_9PEZI
MASSYRKPYVHEGKSPNKAVSIVVAIAWVALNVMNGILNQERLADHKADDQKLGYQGQENLPAEAPDTCQHQCMLSLAVTCIVLAMNIAGLRGELSDHYNYSMPQILEAQHLPEAGEKQGVEPPEPAPADYPTRAF